MKRIVKPFVILISAIVLMSSCLGDDDGYNDFILYSDTAITSFSLGTLNRTMWTTSSTGEDSSYVDEIGCSSYKFYIDQLKREIYNPDSLPVHTDVAHTLCEIESKNSGIVILVHKDIEGKDSLVYFNSSDSIDFTEPREFRVYSLDGAAYRSYKVSVNVHKDNPDSMNWQTCSCSASRTEPRLYIQALTQLAWYGPSSTPAWRSTPAHAATSLLKTERYTP